MEVISAYFRLKFKAIAVPKSHRSDHQMKAGIMTIGLLPVITCVPSFRIRIQKGEEKNKQPYLKHFKSVLTCNIRYIPSEVNGRNNGRAQA